MSEIINRSGLGDERRSTAKPSRVWLWLTGAAAIALAVLAWPDFFRPEGGQSAASQTPTPQVRVSKPLLRDIDTRIGFLGQFSAVDRVELRAQVGGTLSGINFKDGQIVHKGDLLFVIDPRPYEIKLAQANAQLQSASARLALANIQLSRSQSLKRQDFASTELVDQRSSEQTAAQAAIDDAKARIRDAQLDLEYCRVTAPFTGRIGARQVSLGSLIAGSRAGTSPTTLLATLVSLDPIYLDFDMSESDYLTFTRERERLSGPIANKIVFSLSDETDFTRQGMLDFVDNALDRSSGTIHARATVSNSNLFLAPGAFARLHVAVSPPAPTLLLPDSAVMLDQSQHVVLTISSDGTVVPKAVETGDLREGLRVIRSGLQPTDRVVIDGVVRAIPGTKVEPLDGTIQAAMAAGGQG
jgi:multidrug efflux system membrane fusion protein